MTDKLGVSHRRACKCIGQTWSTQWRRLRIADDEPALTAAIIELARKYGRYGYRRITALLRADGWHVNEKRVYRIWRREGVRKISNRSRIDCLTNGTNEANKAWTALAQ